LAIQGTSEDARAFAEISCRGEGNVGWDMGLLDGHSAKLADSWLFVSACRRASLAGSIDLLRLDRYAELL